MLWSRKSRSAPASMMMGNDTARILDHFHNRHTPRAGDHGDGGLGPTRIRSAYSCSWETNPEFGSATFRRALTNCTACRGVSPRVAMRNAATILVLLLMPSTQWTSTRAEGSARASRRNWVLVGRCAASSANGRSSTGICVCVSERVGGRATKPGIAERTWVIPRAERAARFSAVARSDT